MNVARLKPFLSHFSEQLKQLHSLSEVKVAGKIKSIINASDGYFITLDDCVGESKVALSPEAFSAYREHLTLNHWVSISGVLSCFIRNSASYEMKHIVYGYDVQPIFQ